MNTMVRGCCKNHFNPTPEFWDKLRVMEKRNKQVNTCHGIDVNGPKADNGERPEKKKREQSLRNTRSDSHKEVHFLCRVMGRMRGPHDVDMMTPTMHPVKNEINTQQQQNKIHHIHFDVVNQSIMLP